MISPVCNTGVCMRIIELEELESSIKVLEIYLYNKSIELEFSTKKKLTKREIYELIFDRCVGCWEMGSIPQGAFAARKVREFGEKNIRILKMERNEGDDKENRGGFKKNLTEGRELTPVKYNSKLMNSIWGLYNRYSVHNFKKNTDAEANNNDTVFMAWGRFFNGETSSARASAEVANAVKH